MHTTIRECFSKITSSRCKVCCDCLIDFTGVTLCSDILVSVISKNQKECILNETSLNMPGNENIVCDNIIKKTKIDKNIIFKEKIGLK